MAAEVLLIAEGRIATVQLLEQLLAYLESSSTLRARSRLLSELRADDFTADSYPLIVRSFSREAHKLGHPLWVLPRRQLLAP
jgi:hypothetical protein